MYMETSKKVGKLLFDIQPRKCSYEDFLKEVAVLDVMDRTGSFAVKQDLYSFLQRVVKKPTDKRIDLYDVYTKNLYKMLVEDSENSLKTWYESYVDLKKPFKEYLQIPLDSCLENKVFNGQKYGWCGRISKYLNAESFYNTKKYSNKDSEYTIGLIKAMYERFHIRNSLACPAFFNDVVNMEGYKKVWSAFMMGCNKPSIFNPHTYYSILKECFEGEILFAPVMGWNSYQIGFYNSNFKHFISTDVIPSTVSNCDILHEEYLNSFSSLFDEPKTIDTYLCPSEKLGNEFINKYENKIDAILFSPPYFDLEVYQEGEQSISSFPTYNEWLKGYWEETIKLCKNVMSPNARLGFVISNYRGNINFCDDMCEVVSKYLNHVETYQVKWGAVKMSRVPKKQENGNFENLYIFT